MNMLLHAVVAAVLALTPSAVPILSASLVVDSPPARSVTGGRAVADDTLPEWSWPVEGPRVVVDPFRAPAHRYAPGHRGIDVVAPVGSVVRAPAAGVVAFRGVVVDRPLITIDHGAGLVTTFEPLDSALRPGDAVAVGDPIGTVATGGRTAPGALHIGVRRNGDYINPLLLFGGVPRAVLLPCCEPAPQARG